jgi:hypothetical protein
MIHDTDIKIMERTQSNVAKGYFSINKQLSDSTPERKTATNIPFLFHHIEASAMGI